MRDGLRIGWVLLAAAVLVAGCGDGGKPKKGPPKAKIVAFEASETTLEEGDEVTLSWETKHASAIELTANGEAVDVEGLSRAADSLTITVEETTSFELLARGRGGDEVVSSLTVTAERILPKILSFTATPDRVDEGEEVVLAWETADATEITVMAAGGAVIGSSTTASGSVSVHPTEAAMYTLRATRRGHEVRATASVTIKGAPAATLTASGTSITWGESIELSWSTEEAETIRITKDGELLLQTTDAAGTLPDTPARTATYGIAAERGTKLTVHQVEVEVTPVVVAFAPVTTEETPIGTPVELGWEVGGASEITISNGDGVETTLAVESPESGTTALELGSTGVFTLTAKSGDLEATAQTTAPILHPPVIAQFDALQAVLSADSGETATAVLVWDGVERAAALELTGDTTGPVDLGAADLANGQVEVEIDAETEFTLRAVNAAGDATAKASVRLVPYPAIASFEARPPYTGEMEAFELAWEATGLAVSLTADGVAVPGVTSEMLTGQLEFKVADTTTYELTVTNEAGDFVSETVEVTVGPLQNLGLDAAPAYVAVGDPLTVSWTNLGGRLIEIRDASDSVVCTESDLETIADGSCAFPITSEGELEFTFHLTNTIGDEIAKTIEVLASAGPIILDFSGAPPVIEAGDQITFSWEVMRDPHGNLPALSLSLGSETFPIADADPLEDTVSFTVDTVGELEFTLSASTPLGTKMATWEATVHGIPTVSLSASAPSYDLVTPVELSWTTEYAEDSLVLFALDAGGDPILPPLYEVPPGERASGSFLVEPVAPTTYRLVATNDLGTARSDEVEVGIVPPAITSFKATPSYVEPLEPFTLEWETSHAEEIEILADGLPVPGISPTDFAGSKILQVAANSTYTLRAGNSSGQVVHEDIEVEVGPTEIRYFLTHGPAYYAVGETAWLYWSTRGGRKLRILHDGNEIFSAANQHQIDGTNLFPLMETPGLHEFILEIENHVGDVFQETLMVRASEGPVILDFQVTPDILITTDFMTFEWEVLDDPNGETPTLSLSDGTNVYDLTGEDPNAGNKTFPISLDPGAYDFTLTATTSMGSTNETISVNVYPGGPIFIDLTATPDETMAGSTIELSWTTSGINQVILAQRYVIESNEPFIDISTTGTELHLTDLCGSWEDERCVDLPFPPSFRPHFGGNIRDSIRIMENGFAGFDFGFTGDSYSVRELPSTDPEAANAHLVPFWADLDLIDGAIFYEFGSDTRGDFLIIQWQGARFRTLEANLNFQILLWKDGRFEYRYGTMEASSQRWADGFHASIGFQNPDGFGEYKNLHFGDQFLTVPGGLSNRGFAFLQDPLPPIGTLDLYAHFGMHQINLVGQGDASVAFESLFVTVHRPMELLTEGPSDFAVEGEPFLVRWSTRNAETVLVEEVGGGVVCAERPALTSWEFCQIVAPTAGLHSYRIVATSSTGLIEEAIVEVEVLPTFEILDFGVSQTDAEIGDSITVTWSATGAENASITANGVEIFPAEGNPNGGQLLFAPLKPTTFVYEVTPPDGRPPKSESVTVMVRTFELELTADQTSVSPGTPVQLGWNIDSPTGDMPRLFMPNAPMEEVDLVADPMAAFLDISGTGMHLPMYWADDTELYEEQYLDVSVEGFEFPFMDGRQSQFVATRAGYLTVGWPDTSELKVQNVPLPGGEALAEGVHLAPYWGDLLADYEVDIFYETFTNTGGDDHFIVQWKVTDPSPSPVREWNFQVVLFANGQFEYRYGSMDPQAEAASNGARRTIGYAMGPTRGSTLHFGGQEGLPGPALAGGLSQRTFRWKLVSGAAITVWPEADTTYEVCGELFDYIACDTVEVELVGALPPVLTLSATPTAVTEGDAIEVSWTSIDAQSVHLGSLAWMAPEETSEPFIDISTTGTELVLTDVCGEPYPDERCADIAFPPAFRFPFAGSVKDAIRVMENGYAGFNFSFISHLFEPLIPGQPHENTHLAPFGRDLDLTSQGAIHYAFGADARGQRLIIQWTDVRTHAAASSLNFQLILWEDGAFDFRYGDMESSFPKQAQGERATIGYQAPDRSHFVAFNGGGVVSGGLAHRSWAYRPVPLPPSGSLTILARSDTNRIDGIAVGPLGDPESRLGHIDDQWCRQELHPDPPHQRLLFGAADGRYALHPDVQLVRSGGDGGSPRQAEDLRPPGQRLRDDRRARGFGALFLGDDLA